jgi:hypothetical protein
MTKKALAKVRLLILDVDGVLTDGRIIMNDRGEETKHRDRGRPDLGPKVRRRGVSGQRPGDHRGSYGRQG